MRTALLETGFEVAPHHVLGEPKYYPELYNWLSGIFGEAPEGSVFILYFTGHGTRIEGGKYVFCLREFPRQGGGHAHSQTAASIIDEAREYFINTSNSRPLLVLVIFDACNRANEDLEEVAVEVRSVRHGGNAYQHTDIAISYAADIQKVAEFKENGCSYYTAALAEVIRPAHPARTAAEALDAAERTLASQGRQQSPVRMPCLHRERMDLRIFASPAGQPDLQVSKPHPAATGSLLAFPYGHMMTPDGTARLALDCTHLPDMTAEEREAVRLAAMRELLEELERRAGDAATHTSEEGAAE